MENLAYTYSQTRLIDTWHGFYMNPNKNHGMVATLDLSKIIYNEPKTFWWTYESLGRV